MLLTLTLLITLALLALPLLSFAANRLVSGQPLMLWQVAQAWLLLLPVLVLWLRLWWQPGRRNAWVALLAAELLFALLVAIGGHTASALAHSGNTLARTAFGSGLWCAAALALLLAAEAIRQLTSHTSWRILLNLQLWLLPLLLLPGGYLDQLSLTKEYVNR